MLKFRLIFIEFGNKMSLRVRNGAGEVGGGGESKSSE